MEGITVHESSIKSAIDEVNSGTNQREATAHNGIEQSTLHGRLYGVTSKAGGRV